MAAAILSPPSGRLFFGDDVLASSPIDPDIDTSGLPPLDELRIDGPVKLVKYLPADKRDAFIGPLHSNVEDTVKFVQRECPSLSKVPAESIIFRPRIKDTAKHTRGIPFRTQTVSLPTTWEPPAQPEKLMVFHIDSKVPTAAPLLPENIKQESRADHGAANAGEHEDQLEVKGQEDQLEMKGQDEKAKVARIAKIMTEGPSQKAVEAPPWSPALPQFSISSGPKTWADLAAEGMLLGE
ncbi:hypothetical protein BD324DRAFT_647779 [Kockovaella imperatae]|uniref:Uncharacterized protein n=1 Tax=Kockovaella imperatae TaxID=4999 RepID=A0A1Y1UTM5_9TREE|nr:hypothetical protein BD324DRAFT_647779 [Kockovaella imperatae]ORX40874.1 hypothetical protein BD324DRAFT_647779 [Kockovaella imperatae]